MTFLRHEPSLRASGRLRLLGTAVAVGLTVVVAGCSASGGQNGNGTMMGGSRTTTGSSAGQGGREAPLTCSAPTSLPGRTVTVALSDTGMSSMMGGDAPMGAQMRLRAAPSTVASGQVSLVASNIGWRTHELVVLPLAAGSAAGERVPGADGRIDEAGTLGESSSSCGAGSGEGITSGSVGWTTVTLPAGRYELVCNLKNHYADGMYQELVVS